MIDAEVLRDRRNRSHVAILSFRLPRDTGARLWFGVWHDDALMLACAFGRVWRLAISNDGVSLGPIPKATT